jgi:hypothetical protein
MSFIFPPFNRLIVAGSLCSTLLFLFGKQIARERHDENKQHRNDELQRAIAQVPRDQQNYQDGDAEKQGLAGQFLHHQFQNFGRAELVVGCFLIFWSGHAASAPGFTYVASKFQFRGARKPYWPESSADTNKNGRNDWFQPRNSGNARVTLSAANLSVLPMILA